MNGWKLELMPARADGAGGLWLSYWDTLHGSDVVFRIYPDGSCRRAFAAATGARYSEADVNVATELLALLTRLQKEHDDAKGGG